MSVPLALTALLGTSPAYGLQLHKELTTRLPHRAKTNVGQIYSTLERLSRDGTIELFSKTDDGLPLYRATANGTALGRAWLAGADLSSQPEWTEFLDRAFLAASLDRVAFSELQRAINATAPKHSTETPHEHAVVALNQAMESTLTALTQALANEDITTHPMSSVRPLRGRRPRA